MQRRTLLKLGVAGSVTLALVGGGAALIYAPAWRDGQLLQPGIDVLRAVARAVLDGSLPSAPAMREAALVGHLKRVQATLSAMPPSTQGEVNQLLALLATAPGRWALAGLGTDWKEASVAQLSHALQGMRVSSLALRSQAYHALRDLTHAAYFSDPSVWSLLGYPGPTKIG